MSIKHQQYILPEDKYDEPYTSEVIQKLHRPLFRQHNQNKAAKLLPKVDMINTGFPGIVSECNEPFTANAMSPLKRKVGRPYKTIKRYNAKKYGVTFNPDPLKHFNNKQYCKYTNDQQRAMLGRIEQGFRKQQQLGDVHLVELHYELGPATETIHFHSLYEMDDDTKDRMIQYYSKYTNTNPTSGRTWPHLDIKLINNEEAWKCYIRKDQQPNTY